ncbi:MAG: TatD family hydrolase [Planctomycetota bacterium]|nr:TatD family hydrolase [Planctomycetota bacterium]
MIDTHCHLTYPDFAGDLGAVLQRAADAGVTGFITIGTDPEDWRHTLDLVERFSASPYTVRASLGLHPNEAAIFTPALAEELRKLARSNPRVVAIGETGLDFFREQCPRDKQLDSLRAHLRISAELHKPFVLHCRDAEEETLAELAAFRERTGAPLKGVWHCFGASQAHAARAAELGLYFGLNGTVTYPKNDALRAVVATLPADRILLETDCPFLPPQGWRGKRNEPSYLTKVVATLAEIRHTSPDDIARLTTDNAGRAFAL